MFSSFALKEIIPRYTERNSDVIVTFLGSMEAFYTVHHNRTNLVQQERFGP